MSDQDITQVNVLISLVPLSRWTDTETPFSIVTRHPPDQETELGPVNRGIVSLNVA